tara:strand:- start:5975 stop:6730 length:756 start_codon:yes stop_codon:yes gene_type:complete
VSQIVAYNKINDAAGVEMFGNAICRSGMFGCESKEAGIIFALQCIAENKPPLEMAKNYHLVKGKLTKRADAMLSDFRRAGGKVIWADLKNESMQAAVFDFEGTKFNASFSMEDAQRAGLVRSGSAWDKTPAAMLRARCVSETLRAIAPEIVQGVYVPEEIDVVKATDVEQAASVTVKPVTVDAEVVVTTAAHRPHLESQIKDNDLEYAVNVYWTKKGNIDLDLDQTWRDLPDGLQQRMEMHFESFRKAIGK